MHTLTMEQCACVGAAVANMPNTDPTVGGYEGALCGSVLTGYIMYEFCEVSLPVFWMGTLVAGFVGYITFYQLTAASTTKTLIN